MWPSHCPVPGAITVFALAPGHDKICPVFSVCQERNSPALWLTLECVSWLEPVRSKHVAEGWEVTSFQIGDEGYLSKYKDGDRFEISFRKGTIVGRTSAGDLNKLKDFAQVIVESIPPNGG